MKFHSIFLVATVLLLNVLVSPLQTAYAYADVSSYALTCSSFSASGSSDAPYVTLYVYDYVSEVYYFTIIPVVDGSYSGTLTFPAFPAGTELDFEAWGTLNPYNVYEDVGYWDDEVWFYDLVHCIPTVEIGPAIPAEFEMRSIICDTPVYESAAGVTLPGANVYVGQTFYADPVASIAADGSHWTQVFVGGWNNPYIPSVCVQ